MTIQISLQSPLVSTSAAARWTSFVCRYNSSQRLLYLGSDNKEIHQVVYFQKQSRKRKRQLGRAAILQTLAGYSCNVLQWEITKQQSFSRKKSWPDVSLVMPHTLLFQHLLTFCLCRGLGIKTPHTSAISFCNHASNTDLFLLVPLIKWYLINNEYCSIVFSSVKLYRSPIQ